jgi:predicted transcriptional regulator
LVSSLPLTVVSASQGLDVTVSGGYTSDLLSNVMGFATTGSVWVTMQGHQNIIAVASLAGLAAVIVAGGVEPEKETIQKAEAEGIILLTTAVASFELVGQLYRLGIKGI